MTSIKIIAKYTVATPVSGNAAARLIELDAATIARGAVRIPAIYGTVKVKGGDENVDCETADYDIYAAWGSNDMHVIPAGSTHLSVLGENTDTEDWELVITAERL